MEPKPTTAFVLSLLAGIFILLGGLAFAALGGFFGTFFPVAGIVFVTIGLAAGVIVLLGAIMMYVEPRQHVAWGIIVLVLSIVSLFTSLGGFLVGMILGIVGGALAIAWHPETAVMPGYPAAYAPGYGGYAYPPYYGPPVAPSPPPSAGAPPPSAPPATPAASTCKNCGTLLSPGAMFCGSCGAKV